MEQRCPVCHEGFLEEIVRPGGEQSIQCSEYPACRFEAENWESLAKTVARFHHPIQPGHS